MSSTIFALATPPGRAALAVMRISGPAAGAALAALAGALPPPRYAALKTLRSPGAREVLDQALALWFPAPASFTGEDLAELHLHGGRAVVAAVEAELAAMGLRLAQPGEFSRRAFEHGKLGLVEAEAIADLVDAESEAQRRQALAQLGGALGRKQTEWRAMLVEAAALMEADLDFPEEGLPERLVELSRSRLGELRAELRTALRSVRGERVRDGYRIAVLGAPNAGKSSLLNGLAGRSAAIVTPVAGTTRDIVEVARDIAGYRVLLADTAGLRASSDPIELEGIRRAKTWAAGADLRLLVVDRADTSCSWTEAAELCGGDDLLVLNKMDLPIGCAETEAVAWAGSSGLDVVSCQADTGELADLNAMIQARVITDLSGADFPATTRLRHRTLLETALTHVEQAIGGTEPELMAEDIRLASRTLKSFSGDVDSQDVLDHLFGSFCIGK